MGELVCIYRFSNTNGAIKIIVDNFNTLYCPDTKDQYLSWDLKKVGKLSATASIFRYGTKFPI
jgi:hypothetical protein